MTSYLYYIFRSTATQCVQISRLGHPAQSARYVLVPYTPHPAALQGDVAIQHSLTRCVPASESDTAPVVVRQFTHQDNLTIF